MADAGVSYLKGFTSFERVVSRNDEDGWSLFRFRGRFPHRRTPLHVAFTPPVETFCARRFGVDAKGLPLAKKPDGDVSDLEWIRPGTAEDRQKIVARSRRPTSVPSLQYDSCPSGEVVGGFLFDFE